MVGVVLNRHKGKRKKIFSWYVFRTNYILSCGKTSNKRQVFCACKLRLSIPCYCLRWSVFGVIICRHEICTVGMKVLLGWQQSQSNEQINNLNDIQYNIKTPGMERLILGWGRMTYYLSFLSRRYEKNIPKIIALNNLKKKRNEICCVSNASWNEPVLFIKQKAAYLAK